VRRRIAPLLLLVAFVALWQGVASTGWFDDFTLASPTEVARAFGDDHALLLDEAGVTAVEIVLGLAISVALGVLTAVAMHLVPPVREAAYPLLLGSQAAPLFVLAPVVILIFGFGLASKLAIITLVCFFPIALNTLAGLRSVEPDLIKLTRSLGASRVTRLWKVELPAALPSLFTGLRLAAVFSVIGAYLAEWAGAERGLGRLVLLAQNQLETPRVYAGTVLLTVMALALFGAVAAIERIAVPWRRSA
jgi:ABC-type nitrate/sulfonate/bicarbonate transport system permease component